MTSATWRSGRKAVPRPIERVRTTHPTDPTWRADALAGSRHSRLLDELVLPTEDHDPDRAAAICGEVVRGALPDLAPALLLLSPAERRRVQALAAWGLTLFDFARQSGLEGERLSQINRWQFNLELALDGEPPGQPAFVLLAEEERRAPWRREGFDRLTECARQRVASPRPATPQAVTEEARRLGRAVVTALAPAETDEAVSEAAVDLAAALCRLHALQLLDDGLRRHQPRLAASELPDRWEAGGEFDSDDVERAAAAERARVVALLAALRPRLAELPRGYRRAARFLWLSAVGLLRQLERRGGRGEPVRLGVFARLRLLLRARWAPMR